MNQISMFDNVDTTANEPLAERLRPRTLEEFAGQKHLIGKGKVLSNLIANDQVTSMIFWGPPGVGKTTLAKIIANTTQSRFITFSAVASGIKEIRQVMQSRAGDSESEPLFLSTRFIALTRRSRMPSCPLWKKVASFSSAPPRRIRPLR